MKKYNPISCDIYDLFEIYAMRHTAIDIKYMEGEKEKLLHGSYVSTLITRNKEEFLVLEDGTSIRLDFIKSFNISHENIS